MSGFFLGSQLRPALLDESSLFAPDLPSFESRCLTLSTLDNVTYFACYWLHWPQIPRIFNCWVTSVAWLENCDAWPSRPSTVLPICRADSVPCRSSKCFPCWLDQVRRLPLFSFSLQSAAVNERRQPQTGFSFSVKQCISSICRFPFISWQFRV